MMQMNETSGVYDDGWAECAVRWTLQTQQDVKTCVFGLWLKPEPGRTQSTFEVSVNDAAPSRYAVRHDVPTFLQIPCRVSAGKPAVISMTCDNSVRDRGTDVRPLSFRLLSVCVS